MAKKSVMPKSKAKTAYGLLSEIRKLILEEPERYDQTGFCVTDYRGHDAPTCGTVGCVAGWVVVLKALPHNVSDGIDAAGDLLGLYDRDVMWDLFDAEAAGERADTATGRRAHARRGAAHIARFQKQYAAQLKAKRV